MITLARIIAFVLTLGCVASAIAEEKFGPFDLVFDLDSLSAAGPAKAWL